MIQYLTQLLQKAYELINPEYTRDKRMAKFEGLITSRRLEGMCSSEVEAMFKITREFPDSEPV